MLKTFELSCWDFSGSPPDYETDVIDVNIITGQLDSTVTTDGTHSWLNEWSHGKKLSKSVRKNVIVSGIEEG